MSSPRAEHVQVDGARLWTAVQGSGVPLLLCHGGPGAYDNLGPVADLIDDVATVYRYDQRGCGRSQGSPPYDISTFIQDIETLRRHWRLDRWIVGGHSWGSDLALAYALAHPDLVIGLVCMSGTGLIAGWRDEVHRSREARLSVGDRKRLRELDRLRETSRGKKLAAVRTERSELLRKAELDGSATVESLPAYDDYPLNHEVNSMLNEDWERFAFSPDLPASVGALRMPCLVIRGDEDTRPEWALRALAERLPNGRFVSMPGAGHDPWVEQPEATRRAIRTFLEGLSPVGSAP